MLNTAKPVALARHWIYIVLMLTAFIGFMQFWGLTWLAGRVNETTVAVDKTTVAVDKMEKQINSNMERQIRQAISEAIAQERLRVEGTREKK